MGKIIRILFVGLFVGFHSFSAVAQTIPLLKSENRWSILNRRDSITSHPDSQGTSMVSIWYKTGNDTIIQGKNVHNNHVFLRCEPFSLGCRFRKEYQLGFRISV